MKLLAFAPIALLAGAAACGGGGSLEPAAPPSVASSRAVADASESDPERRRAVASRNDEDDGEAQKKETRKDDPAPASSVSPSPAPSAPELPEVVFEEIEPSPAPARIPTVSITSPARNSVIRSAKVADTIVKIDVKDWELAGGNHIQLVVDNRPGVRVEDSRRAFKLGELVDAKELGPGQHFVAAIPTRGNGESVKPVGKKVPVAVVSFFVEKKTPQHWKEGSPLLVFSPPRSGPVPRDGLLVDFYVLNARVERGRFVIHASVSGPGLRAGESLSEWKPWKVKNARPGLYAIQVGAFQFEAAEFDSSSTTAIATVSKPAAGRWNSVTAEFSLTTP
ncbi:MAG TPA: hypothetical protein PLI95_11260 [Polyangiaceae bacterium]|nr:hypothetical protein [Polyangiaceae bacterium]